MTLEASVELDRIAAQVREDALLLDLVQSTPIGGLLDVLHREARAVAVVAEINGLPILCIPLEKSTTPYFFPAAVTAGT